MNTPIPHPEKEATLSALTGIAGAIFDGVMAGLGTVVGSVEGALGLGNAPETVEKPTPLAGRVQAAQLAAKTVALKPATAQPKQSKTRSVKAKVSIKAPKKKASRAKKTVTNVVAKSKAVRHK